jgi:hypothetical protein
MLSQIHTKIVINLEYRLSPKSVHLPFILERDLLDICVATLVSELSKLPNDRYRKCQLGNKMSSYSNILGNNNYY